MGIQETRRTLFRRPVRFRGEKAVYIGADENPLSARDLTAMATYCAEIQELSDPDALYPLYRKELAREESELFGDPIDAWKSAAENVVNQHLLKSNLPARRRERIYREILVGVEQVAYRLKEGSLRYEYFTENIGEKVINPNQTLPVKAACPVPGIAMKWYKTAREVMARSSS